MSTPLRARRNPRNQALVSLEKQVLAALEDMKAVNVRVLDVRGLTDVADTMIVASGNSDRHVRAVAERVVEKAKEMGRRPMGLEGTRDGEWVLVDLQDVLVHVMLPRVRELYALEQLWEVPQASRQKAEAHTGKTGKARKPASGKTAGSKRVAGKKSLKRRPATRVSSARRSGG
jgi:ribosome-associated protein